VREQAGEPAPLLALRIADDVRGEDAEIGVAVELVRRGVGPGPIGPRH
jgi:hypothetical protein